MINYPQKITIDSWYKPFPNRWFIIVIATLHKMWVLVLVPLIQKPVVNASSQTHKRK